jgi:hypothetical protein
MNDESFARLVAEDVKNKSSRDQKAYLMLPENWTRWQRALAALKDNLSEQIDRIVSQEDSVAEKYKDLGDEGLKILTELRADWDDRRKKIERFRYYVEQKYDEVTRMIAVGGDEVDERLSLVDFYRKAISKHRELMFRYEMDPTPIDGALWSSLDGKWEFDGITEETAFSSFGDDD